jgi:hypothetical protein
MKKLMLAVTLLSLTACNTNYNKPGATMSEFKKDIYECNKESRATLSGYGSNVFIQGAAINNMRDACMEARGYTK